jgi:hypothetical protein
MTAEVARKSVGHSGEEKEFSAYAANRPRFTNVCNFTFYALGLLELQMMSQKFRYLKIFILTH